MFFHWILEIQLTCKFIILYPWANQNIKLFFILCNFIIKKTSIKTYKPYIHFDYIFFFLFFSFSFFLHTQYTIQNTNSKQINKNYMKITIKAPKQSGIYRDSLLHQQNSVRQTSGTVWTVTARLLHAPPWLAARGFTRRCWQCPKMGGSAKNSLSPHMLQTHTWVRVGDRRDAAHVRQPP
jgi:hypothetical protein